MNDEGTKTLLERAKEAAIPAGRKPTAKTKQDIDLALAWIMGDVTAAQAASAWGCRNTAVPTRVLYTILDAARRQKVSITAKE